MTQVDRAGPPAASHAPERPAGRAVADRPPLHLRRRRDARRATRQRAVRAGLAARPTGSRAHGRYEALPVETEPAVHDRTSTCATARLADGPPVRAGRPARRQRSPSTGRGRPAGRCTTGLIELREDGVAVASSLSEAARAAGVILETFGAAFAARDPTASAPLIDGGADPARETTSSPSSTRAFWSQGVRLCASRPASGSSSRSSSAGWSAAPDRALLTRTIIELGEDAEASLVEELVPYRPADRLRGRRRPFPRPCSRAPCEVNLGRGAPSCRSPASRTSARDQVAFQHRHASIGRQAGLHWALAQLGGRFVRSRVDNRLEGDRSSVEQVEIVFGVATTSSST